MLRMNIIADGKATVVLGLSERNLVHLRAGRSIRFDAQRVNLRSGPSRAMDAGPVRQTELVITYGETEEEIAREVGERFGLQGAELEALLEQARGAQQNEAQQEKKDRAELASLLEEARGAPSAAPPEEPQAHTLDALKVQPPAQEVEEYARTVAGAPPSFFDALIKAAGALNERVARELGFDLDAELPDGDDEASTVISRLQDTLLLAAYGWSHGAHKGAGENRIAFVQRARQVVQWCTANVADVQTPLEILENKARELARVIARRLFRGDDYVLVLANSGEAGSMTWISSIARESAAELLGELVGKMKADQAPQPGEQPS